MKLNGCVPSSGRARTPAHAVALPPPSSCTDSGCVRRLPNYTAEIDGVSLHFIHKPSERAGARPLILCHGWPGGVFELLNAADLLTNPPEGQQAFHVVIPSLPGFGFSSSYDRPWTMEDAAATYDELMRLLGYTTFAAQGTDWGSITARCLGALYPSRCKGALRRCSLTPPLLRGSLQLCILTSALLKDLP